MNHVATLARLSSVYRVFARLVTLDFGCQMSEAGSGDQEDTGREASPRQKKGYPQPSGVQP